MRHTTTPTGTMVQHAGTGSSQIAWRPSFPFPGSAASSAVTTRSNTFDAHEIVRRFSDPATDEEKNNVDKYIKHAVEAYHDAVVQLRQILKSEDLDSILSSSSNVTELHKVAIGIQRAQNNVLDKRKIAKFVDTIDQFSGVFDVLSQCDFGYMTLIWGSLKFILVVSKSHYDTLHKFADMMCDIGRNLARIELYRHIFPTSRMLELVSELYSAILEFLSEFILYLQKKTYRKFFGNFTKPFDIQFGRLVTKIRNLQQTIEDDARAGALVMQVVQTKSLTRHRVDLSLRRNHYEACLMDIHEGQVTPLFVQIKKTLFHGFEIEASYHEELATTFKMTSSPAWAQWLSIEQQYVPSKFSHETTIVQAECDAPDMSTCLQWVAQARSESPHVVSAFLLWARGMTAQSAIASIVFQMLQQRPQVLSAAGLTMKSFSSANSSLPKLWSLFLSLVQQLGGLMVYISIGSVGQEEFGIVQRFVDLCRKWNGPPINVIIIHPFDENFVRVEDCVDLDDKYDVHPSLTTTDALHHVILLELNIQESLSETVQMVLWEALWREVRYAVIGIAVTQTIDEIRRCAEELAIERECEDDVASLWISAVTKWTKNKREFHNMREQIQRHLSIVDIHLPAEVRARLGKKLANALESRLHPGEKDKITKVLRQGEPKPLEDDQRNEIWEHIQEAVRPGTMEMYNTSIRSLAEGIIDAYLEDPPQSEREARRTIQELHKPIFGWNGRWKKAFSDCKEPVVDGMVASIDVGFGDVVDVIIAETI